MLGCIAIDTMHSSTYLIGCIYFVGLCFILANAVPKNSQRIVGGAATQINRYPDLVVLLFSFDLVHYYHACGGTILTSKSILTAAHCPVGDPENRWRVRVGSTKAHSGGVVHTLSSYLIHPSFNIAAPFDADLAIMWTATGIIYNNNVQKARIAGTSYHVQDNQVVWAAGWGTVNYLGMPSEELRHVQIWKINDAVCRSRYALIERTVTDSMLCSGWLDFGGRDQCQGDSGSPLYHNGVVVGICSWGVQCALPEFPGVNVKISNFTQWIQTNARGQGNTGHELTVI